MQTIPQAPDRNDADPIADGYAILRYTIEHGHAPIGLEPDRYARAEKAAQVAGQYHADESAIVAGRLADATRALGAARRRAERIDAEPVQMPATIQPPAPNRGEGPRVPADPIPFERPPAAPALPTPSGPARVINF
jgi:hypothetical protein